MNSDEENLEINGISVPRERINNLFLCENKNCMSITNMLVKLGGHNAKFEFCSDPNLAEVIYSKGVNDMIALGLDHNIFFFDKKEDSEMQAQLCVVHYKRSKLSRARLVVVGCLRINFSKRHGVTSPLIFVRLFHLPCKY